MIFLDLSPVHTMVNVALLGVSATLVIYTVSHLADVE